MTELSQEILSELEIIKWLLVVIVAIGLYFTLMVIVAVNKLASNNTSFGKKLQQSKRETELEEMLAKGDAEGVKISATEWASSHPEEPLAHWYLAKAYDRLGQYIEAKKTLTELQKLSPNWNNSIEPWLSSIEENLKPKSVD